MTIARRSRGPGWTAVPGAILLLALAAASLSAGAATYRCEDASGKVTYTDRPCAEGPAAEKRVLSAPAPVPVPAARPAAESAPAAQPYRRPQPVVVPPLPEADLSGLPKDAQGRPVLSQSGGAALVLDKPAKLQPVNVLAACSALVTRCYKPGERELDACFMSVPRCASAKPWDDPAYTPCCPAQCWQQYEARRIAGMPSQAALHATLFGGRDGGAGAEAPCIAAR